MTSIHPQTSEHPIIIVGGGLAGLTAARRLHQARIAFRLLEARDRLGGRILSVDASGSAVEDGFDLGPSWFWPHLQVGLGDLVRELGLAFFPQSSDGDVIFHRMSREAPQRYRGMRQEPQSMRVTGGSGAIISALASGLPQSSVQLGARVKRVTLAGEVVEVEFADVTGADRRIDGSQVLFALPPRLLEATVEFSPTLDAGTAQRWREAPTWMAPHAKFFAVYDRPFWRDAGLSGTAQSMVGPLVEIHDATTASGKAALFGFVGVPAQQRATVGREAIIAASVQQLVQLFGLDAGAPRATLLKDWAADPLTATPDDLVAGGHPAADPRPWVTGNWSGRIVLIGSETSRTEPGYLAGAVEAAERTVAGILSGSTASPHPQATREHREARQ